MATSQALTHAPEPREPGIWPAQWLAKAIDAGVIGGPDFDDAQIQPASVDLRLADQAYRLRCSFLPGKNDLVSDQLRVFAVGPPIDLHDGAILERNRPYLIPLQETLNLPGGVRARANPKSSTGRVDVFTRVVTDRSSRFDDVRPGYRGRLYLEVVPRSFTVMVRTGLSLNQLRVLKGDVRLSDKELRATHRHSPLLYRQEGSALDRREIRAHDGLWLSLDLMKRGDAAVGYRARRNSKLIDLSRVAHYEPSEYWEPVVSETGNRVVLEPEEFYLLLSAEAVRIPPEYAAEMTALDPSGGEVRTHYAGFFDPGFGHDPNGLWSLGSRAALEIRAHEVPFAVDHLQRVCKLRFERMAEVPDLLYGAGTRSHYQGQLSTLSKHFRVGRGVDQLTFRPLGMTAPNAPERESSPTVQAAEAAEKRGLLGETTGHPGAGN